MSTADANNYSDILDSRDIIARIEEIESSIDDAVAAGVQFDLSDTYDVDSDEIAALRILRSVASQVSGYADDWQYGATLIRDDYFETYAQELAEDTSDIDFSKLIWPLTCIDWEAAARDLQQDYTSVDFDGVAYWVR